MVNYDDVIQQLRDHGLQVDALEVNTSRVVRCVTQCNPREKRGWYWLSTMDIDADTYIIGGYGIYTGNDNGKQKIALNKQSASRLTDEQREAIKAQQKESQRRAEAERKRQADKAAAKAAEMWSKLDHDGTSEYLERKQIHAHGVRFRTDGTIAVPMLDDRDTIRGLQFILPRGHERSKATGRDKEFWPYGLEMSATHCLIGGQPLDLLLIAEGYATGASLFEATGYPVAVVWSANNIMPAAKMLAKKHPRARILICGDDDWVQKCDHCQQYTPVATGTCQHCEKLHRKTNAGKTCAEAAALAVSGAWVLPQFSKDRPTDRKSDTDFNDLHVAEGLRQVAAQINDKLAALGWMRQAPRLSTEQGGGGERPELKSMLSISEALERFALVYGGKGTMFDYQEHCLIPKTDVVDILPEHGWRDMRAHKRVVRLDEVGFDPAGTDPRIKCNLYGGWPTKPVEGDCTALLDLLRYLCSDETEPEAVFDWVIKWLAYPIQHPGAKMRTSLIFHGAQGTGKNLFFEEVMKIYGEYGRIVDQAAIEDKFNDWASRKLFLIADEVVARAELYHLKNKLKSFVTGEWIRINPKNVAAHDERNHVNIVFLSNESIPTAVEQDDRRYMVIHTPPKNDPGFYEQISQSLKNGAGAAFHHYLLNLDLTGFNEHTKPMATKSKTALIETCRDSVQSFVSDWAQGQIKNIPFCPCKNDHLYAIYLRYCDKNLEKPRTKNKFLGDLRMIPHWSVDAQNVFVAPDSTERTTRRMVVPSEQMLAGTKYEKKSFIKREHWLAISYEAFAVAGDFEL